MACFQKRELFGRLLSKLRKVGISRIPAAAKRIAFCVGFAVLVMAAATAGCSSPGSRAKFFEMARPLSTSGGDADSQSFQIPFDEYQPEYRSGLIQRGGTRIGRHRVSLDLRRSGEILAIGNISRAGPVTDTGEREPIRLLFASCHRADGATNGSERGAFISFCADKLEVFESNETKVCEYSVPIESREALRSIESVEGSTAGDLLLVSYTPGLYLEFNCALRSLKVVDLRLDTGWSQIGNIVAVRQVCRNALSGWQVLYTVESNRGLEGRSSDMLVAFIDRRKFVTVDFDARSDAAELQLMLCGPQALVGLYRKDKSSDGRERFVIAATDLANPPEHAQAAEIWVGSYPTLSVGAEFSVDADSP